MVVTDESSSLEKAQAPWIDEDSYEQLRLRISMTSGGMMALFNATGKKRDISKAISVNYFRKWSWSFYVIDAMAPLSLAQPFSIWAKSTQENLACWRCRPIIEDQNRARSAY